MASQPRFYTSCQLSRTQSTASSTTNDTTINIDRQALLAATPATSHERHETIINMEALIRLPEPTAHQLSTSRTYEYDDVNFEPAPPYPHDLSADLSSPPYTHDDRRRGRKIIIGDVLLARRTSKKLGILGLALLALMVVASVGLFVFGTVDLWSKSQRRS
ncbi:hypothetical protein BDW62DRAFT_199180 [Aspergillus aurantiobrunneus]